MGSVEKIAFYIGYCTSLLVIDCFVFMFFWNYLVCSYFNMNKIDLLTCIGLIVLFRYFSSNKKNKKDLELKIEKFEKLYKN